MDKGGEMNQQGKHMLRIMAFTFAALLAWGCVPIESKTKVQFITKPVALFDKNSVYKFEISRAGPKKIKDSKPKRYIHRFAAETSNGYIEYLNNNRYLATLSSGGFGKTDQYEITIEKFDRSFSLLSDYYIFNAQLYSTKMKDKGKDSGGYFYFMEKTRSGEWYSYIPSWPNEQIIEMKTRKEFLAFAERVFSQSRDKSARQVTFLQRDRSDIDYIETRKQHAKLVEEKRQKKLKQQAKKAKPKPPAAKKSQQIKDTRKHYMICDVYENHKKKRLLVTIDRSNRTMSWAPPDRPQKTVNCILEETDTYSMGLCKGKPKSIGLDVMLIKPNYDYEALVTSPDWKSCNLASSKPPRNSGALEFAYSVYYKTAKKYGSCTPRSWAKAHDVKPDSANIVTYKQLRINRYSLSSRLLSGKTVQIYNKKENTNYWTNQQRWKNGDTGSCQFTKKPQRQF